MHKCRNAKMQECKDAGIRNAKMPGCGFPGFLIDFRHADTRFPAFVH